ncbi:hypothetical protein SH528x_002108 [Novipirellula sp. SH528]|uniref:hypothetical protein n=1 Tax=Novipirellula sp. SH528 TaxID=3454466 RepID=UPI003FA069DD
MKYLTSTIGLTAATLLLGSLVVAQEPQTAVPPLTSTDTSQAYKTELELFASLDQSAGNIAYMPDGQLVFSHHPFFKPDIRVATYDETTKSVTPFPNKQWNTPRTENDWYLDDVLGIRTDENGIVWMLDMGTRNNITPKLVGCMSRN